MKNLILILAMLISVNIVAQNPCSKGKIIINGNNVDAVFIENNDNYGFNLPLWLEANSTIAAGDRVQLISVIEFNEEAQSGGNGYSLVYNRVLNVGSQTQTVPAGKVWKIEAIIKHADPFIAGLSVSSNSPICFDGTLNLFSSVANATYSWIGPNGFTSTSQNPTISNVSFSNAGKYFLTTTHNGCTYSDTLSVVINPLPASTFTNTFAIAGYYSVFTPTVSGLNYSWTFDQGSPATSNAQNPNVQWSTAGSYNASLTATNSNGCTSSTTNSVTVSNCLIGQSQSDFSWTTASAGYATTFTPNESGAASYAWSFDQGSPATSTDENPDITWANAGTYAVTLTVSLSNGCYTTTQTVTVANCEVSKPESDFSWSTSATPPMANDIFTFTPDQSGANSYMWIFDQGSPAASTSQNPNVTWASGGTYDATLVVFLTGGCYTTTQSVTIFNGQLTFTNCGQTGTDGPSQGQCDTEYSGTALAGNVTVSGGIQEWIVPSTGTYRIEVYGAQGGISTGGKGAKMSGDFALTTGSQLKILVGQQGARGLSDSWGHGGGGGTFVTLSDNTPLIIAGGGGGASPSRNVSGGDALIGETGSAGTNGGAGGSSGDGGKTGPTNGVGQGGGGGGLLSDGGGWSTNGAGSGGQAFVNGGVGGVCVSISSSYHDGGFGGGGGGTGHTPDGGGGGGGYSGGGGGGTTSSSANGGGGGGGC